MKSTTLPIAALLLLMTGCGDDADPENTDDAGITNNGGTPDGGSNTSDAGGPKDDGKITESVINKLKECKITQREGDGIIRDDADRCTAKCVVDATCDTLREFACDELLPMANNPLPACLGKCPGSPADGYRCGEASAGLKIAHATVCDGFEDCNDGADEKNCPEYTCKDGEKVTPSDVKCDGFEDCNDGSDEAACAPSCT